MTYRDLFLLAAVVDRGNLRDSTKRSAKARLRLRLVAKPPEQAAWLRLGHDDDPSIHDSSLSDDFDVSSVSQSMVRGAANPTQVLMIVERYWEVIREWMLKTIEELVGNGPEPIRLNVVSATPSLWATPWEWLETVLQRDAPTRSISINRAVPMHWGAPPLQIRQSLKLLVLPSNPKDERKMDVFRELQLLHTPPGMQREQAHAATFGSVSQQISTWQPNVLHYVGHAGLDGQEGNLILEDPSSGSTAWINSQELERALFPSIRLLCLATCVTAPNYDIRGFASVALGDSGTKQTSLPSIVYTQFPISEQSSVAFWEAFYAALQQPEEELTSAVAKGRKAVRDLAPQSTDWSSFVLVLRDQFNVNAGRPFVLSSQQPESFEPESYPATTDHLDSKNLQSYFASMLANQLEALHSEASSATEQATDHLQVLRAEIDRLKGLIQ